MSSKAETVVSKITIVQFRAYDRPVEHHFVDATPEQCTAYIFKHICNTAVINKITEYTIEQATPIYGFKKKMEE